MPLAGGTALDTMYTVARNAYTAGADSAVVCTLDGYYDALSAAPYARVVGGPVLLTESNHLSAQTAQAIEDLGAKSVTISTAGNSQSVTQHDLAALQARRDRVNNEMLSLVGGARPLRSFYLNPT